MNRKLKWYLLKLPLDIIDAALNGKVHCVQVGANDGTLADPLYPYFRDRGWQGFLLEPHPVYYRRLAELHKQRDTVTLRNVGASDTATTSALYYLDEAHEHLYRPEARGCASFDRDRMIEALAGDGPASAEHVSAAQVSLQRMDDILADAGIGQTDVLVIDTEGHEVSVLSGLTLAQLRPKYAMVEVTERANREPVFETFRAAGYHCFFHKKELVAVSSDFPDIDLAGMLRVAGMQPV